MRLITAIVLLCALPTISSEDYTRISSNPALTSISSNSKSATEHSWEFNDGSLEGWGSAASSEQGGEVYASGGEMRISITNSNIHFDSPRLQIITKDRHALAIRYKYVGSSHFGKVTLQSKANNLLPDLGTMDHSVANWENTTWNASATGDRLQDVRFPIIPDGQWHTTYANFQYKNANQTLIRVFDEVLNQIRVHPALYTKKENALGHTFHIDFIRLVSAPAIERITGCNGEKYSDLYDFGNEHFELTMKTTKINDFLEHYQTLWERRRLGAKNVTYSRCYNCLRNGGEVITLEGRNFGNAGANGAPAIVYIGEKPCTNLIHDEASPQTMLTCVTPAMGGDNDNNGVSKLVQIKNGKLPGLEDRVNYFEYAKFAQKPEFLTFSNIASRAVDLTWSPGGDIWDAMVHTGYAVRWRKMADLDANWNENIVGNVTTTTVINLSPDTLYEFEVAGTNEDQNDSEWHGLDLYGRRDLLKDGLVGAPISNTVSTLGNDIYFPLFNANMTQNYTSIDTRSTLGPTGVWAGEGHFGLVLVGDANIENCNTSVVCCDTYDPSIGPEASCGGAANSMSCSGTSHPNPSYVNGEAVGRGVPSNLPGGEIMVEPFSLMKPLVPTLMCGPALRLTASDPRLTGAAWYAREQEVGEGFDTTFKFRIANPSLRCNVMDDAHTNCRSRGADGLAFVVQSLDGSSLGEGGEKMGYGGIRNSLAVEFDTFYNHEELEQYENHISVQSRGWREENDANQMFSLGSTSEIPDLTDGEIEVRIVYNPVFDERALEDPHFVVDPYTSHFLENGDFSNGGLGDWGVGVGLLSVFLGNLDDPVLIVPLNLESLLDLNAGRAFVGFSAATGANTWQVHDVLEWKFDSLRIDKNKGYEPPLVVGGVDQAHSSCGEKDEVCVHP